MKLKVYVYARLCISKIRSIFIPAGSNIIPVDANWERSCKLFKIKLDSPKLLPNKSQNRLHLPKIALCRLVIQLNQSIS